MKIIFTMIFLHYSPIHILSKSKVMVKSVITVQMLH